MKTSGAWKPLLLGALVLAGTAAPAGAAANGPIAFTAQLNGPAQVFVVNPDGSGLLAFGNGAGYADISPAWSPDGTKIAFARVVDPGVGLRPLDTDVYVMNADGTEPLAITTGSASDTYPTWSPDGTKLAFARW